MTKKTIDMIVDKQMKRHRAEVALLWLIVAVGAFLLPAVTCPPRIGPVIMLE